jgi:hypothetical protein
MTAASAQNALTFGLLRRNITSGRDVEFRPPFAPISGTKTDLQSYTAG